MANETIDDLLSEIESAANDTQTRVTTDVADLKQQIEDLKAQIAAQGQATDAQQTRMKALVDQMNALDPTNPATLKG